MLYTNKDFESENRNKKAGFSLVEVMMTLLILSMVMVLMAPVMTKKVTVKKNEGVVYTYNPNSLATDDDYCYVASINDYDSNTPKESYSKTKNCSQYTFTVPDGVDRINLTLVAGGGGGGGAGGRMQYPHEMETLLNAGKPVKIEMEKLKKIVINFFSANGAGGGKTCMYGCGNSETEYFAGRGGKSSSAILNFEIPKNLLRNNFVTSLQENSTEGSFEKETTTINSKPSTRIGLFYNTKPQITYYVNNPIDGNFNPIVGVGCEIPILAVVNSYDYTSENFPLCKMAEENITGEKVGNETFKIHKDKTITPPLTLAGSTGGMIENYTNYGYGGDGGNFELESCPAGPGHSTCQVKNAAKKSHDPQPGGAGTADVVWYEEGKSGVGGGGAPGTFIRLLGFPVNPNEEYIVYVGKGGEGGMPGNTQETPSTTKFNGKKGEGGVTTSIWKKTGTSTQELVYMVTGGAGGEEGGSSYLASIGSASLSDGENGKSPRHYQNYFVGVGYGNLAAVDAQYANATSADTSHLHIYPTGITAIYQVDYPVLGNDSEPYASLVKRNRSMATYTPTITLDKRLGGFNTMDNLPQGKNVKYTESSNITSAYTGFYKRTLVDNMPAYVGMSGGISGLGTKAGCGGLFMGNFDGRKNTGTLMLAQEKQYLTNKFVAVTDSGSGPFLAYNISDYYEGCTMDTPDGQSATFITPDPVNQTFGSAGAGGGGGGYSLSLGSGKGGRGQDGYLMIDWKK